MLKEFAEVWRYRELLLNLVVRDIKVRYKNSLLGFVWSFIVPASQVVTLTIVMKFVFQIKVDNYSAYLFIALITWGFISMSMLDSTTAVLTHAGLVKKTYFPREILPLSVVLSNLVHFVFALGVFFLYCLVIRTPIQATWALLPVLLLISFMFSAGLSLILCCLNTYYEDVKYLLMVVLNLLFYATPTVYFVEQVIVRVSESRFKPLLPLVEAFYLYNPLSYLVIAFRKALLQGFSGDINGIQVTNMPLDYRHLVFSGVISVIIFLAGYRFFNSKKWYFAERL